MNTNAVAKEYFAVESITAESLTAESLTAESLTAESFSVDSSLLESSRTAEHPTYQTSDGKFQTYAQMYNEYWKIGMRFLSNDSRISHEREDLVQTAMLKVLQSYNQFQRRSKFSTWFYSILRNTVLDHYKKEFMPLDETPNTRYTQSWDNLDECTNNAIKDEPEHRIIRSIDDATDLKNEIVFLSKMPRIYSDVLFYRKLAISYTNIAKIEGIPIGTVKTHISRAKKMLSEMMDTRYNPFITEEKLTSALDSLREVYTKCTAYEVDNELAGAFDGGERLELEAMLNTPESIKPRTLSKRTANKKYVPHLDRVVEAIKNGYDNRDTIMGYLMQNNIDITKQHLCAILDKGKRIGKINNPTRGKWHALETHSNHAEHNHFEKAVA